MTDTPGRGEGWKARQILGKSHRHCSDGTLFEFISFLFFFLLLFLFFSFFHLFSLPSWRDRRREGRRREGKGSGARGVRDARRSLWLGFGEDAPRSVIDYYLIPGIICSTCTYEYVHTHIRSFWQATPRN